MTDTATNESFRTYDLTRARAQRGAAREPKAHQRNALGKLARWYEGKTAPTGGILTLPTGGGKTFTAVRFLCTYPLSDGYKVLWLAHTHHLLDQAIDSFGPKDAVTGGSAPEVATIAEPRAALNVRVVSGTPQHSRVHAIKASDDVLIITLQTAARAYHEHHPALKRFLDSAKGKLVVVFDEAHHAPAPSFRRFLTDLRADWPTMRLLGLTATPTYSDERRQGWLKKLFPQGIVYQVSASQLMADRVLAQPKFEACPTEVVPEFDERSYDKWVASFGDLPEHVIEHLAKNQQRNDRIVDTYVRNRKRYGRTIIFTDRWFQCEYIAEHLRRRGVRADAVYSHVDADPGSAAARNARTSDDNAQVLRDFKRGKLDVLVNVRMLTEGTDVPDVQTVFLTRQTTSRVLHTQMVGRALRGPAFGGTEHAYIVTFLDNWRQSINWAEFDQLTEGHADPDMPEQVKRPPVQLISIELVRKLVRQMQTGRVAQAGPFLTLLPVGWYRVEYDAAVADTDDTEPVRQLVMVFEDERTHYAKFLKSLTAKAVTSFAAVEVTATEQLDTLKGWAATYFDMPQAELGSDLIGNLFHLARHVAQSGEVAEFFAFAEREGHDLDVLAERFVTENLGPIALDQALCAEYERRDRYWRALYGNYALFQAQYLAAQSRVVDTRRHGGAAPATSPIVDTPESHTEREPSDAVKHAVKRRDGQQCLCCGATHGLQIDHVAPSYLGGTNDMENLQTLCGTCNRDKRIREINFRVNRTPLTRPPASFAPLAVPQGTDVRDPECWRRYLRRTLNFYYQCAAVDHVTIGRRGQSFYHWTVQLYAGNDAAWLQPHVQAVHDAIEMERRSEGVAGPEDLAVLSA